MHYFFDKIIINKSNQDNTMKLLLLFLIVVFLRASERCVIEYDYVLYTIIEGSLCDQEFIEKIKNNNFSEYQITQIPLYRLESKICDNKTPSEYAFLCGHLALSQQLLKRFQELQALKEFKQYEQNINNEIPAQR